MTAPAAGASGHRIDHPHRVMSHGEATVKLTGGPGMLRAAVAGPHATSRGPMPSGGGPETGRITSDG